MDILDVFRMPLLRRVNESSYRPAVLDGQEPRRPYRRSHEDRRKVAVDAGQHDCGWDSDSTRRWSSDSVKQKHATHSLASAASASTMIVTNGKEASVASGAWFAYRLQKLIASWPKSVPRMTPGMMGDAAFKTDGNGQAAIGLPV